MATTACPPIPLPPVPAPGSASGDSDVGGLPRAPSPEECLEELDARVRELVQDGFLNQGQGNALLATLDATVGGLERENVDHASNTLTAFINQLEAFDSGAVLPHELAQDLINLAQSCLDAMGNA